MKRLPLEKEIEIAKQSQCLVELDSNQFALALSALIRIYIAKHGGRKTEMAMDVFNMATISEEAWHRALAIYGCSIPVQDLYKEMIAEAKENKYERD